MIHSVLAICQRRLLKQRLKRIRSATLPYRNVVALLDTLGPAFDRTRPMIHGLASRFTSPAIPEPVAGLHHITLRYLLDRVTSTPVNILRLCLQDPVLAGPDAASLHRSAFESAVNLLYLQHGDQLTRLQSLYIMAFDSERRMCDAISQWCGHPDRDVSARADHQMAVQDQPTDAARADLLRTLRVGDEAGIGQYPNIRQRCSDIGPIWEFFYDARFRGLSAWQHGDPTRAAVSSSLMMRFPEWSDRTVFESLLVASWTWDLLYYLIHTMAQFAGVSVPDSLSALHTACRTATSYYMRHAFVKYHLARTQTEGPEGSNHVP